MQQPQYPQPDQIYATFNKALYRITGDEASDDVMNMLQSDPTASPASGGGGGGGSVTVAADSVDSGASTSSTVQAGGAATQQGKLTFDNTTSGYILGFDPKNGKAKFYIGDSVSYINWDGSSLTIVGGVNVSSLNIPDTTTANSFHVDSSGNTWWGSNVAGGVATAKAYILDTGAAFFNDIQTGGNTYQYTHNDYGMFTYGDFSDGLVTLDGTTDYNNFSSHSGTTYTLTRDVFCTNLTINNNIVLDTGGWRIYVTGTLHLIGGGTIRHNGTDGGTGGNFSSVSHTGAAGAAGVGATAGYFLAQPSGQVGGAGTQGSASGGGGIGGLAAGSPGTTGNGSSHSLYLGNASDGGTGGGSPSAGISNSVGGAGGTHGSTTFRTQPPNSLFHITTMFDVTAGVLNLYNGQAGGGSGGGGGGGTGTNAGESPGGGGGGGGSGGNGGVIWIAARNMLLDTSGNINANGGNGGNGGNGSNASAAGTKSSGGGGGGGGAGGSGGIIFLVYNTITNNGTIAAAGGIGGTGGTGGTGYNSGGSTAGLSGVNGNPGSDGGSGITITKQLSM